ncbi:unnamed protein product [Pleuronectes platessa]|uniref:Uncharacterized protein n=1 Tax=Pleuronectes platessa TaxID=8262 RepID=A0A9N7Z4A5_PLEPL|nr:unnamed protein product [Pleuronectes platessa]
MSIHVSSQVREDVCVCGGAGAWLPDVTAVCSVNADVEAEDGAEEEKSRRCLTPLNHPSPSLDAETRWHFLFVSILYGAFLFTPPLTPLHVPPSVRLSASHRLRPPPEENP